MKLKDHNILKYLDFPYHRLVTITLIYKIIDTFFTVNIIL